MSKTPRIRIPPEVKKYVFQRDKYQCKTTVETNLSIDHTADCALIEYM
jgi:5-methylcytosine-specific restriction enzyme A